MIDNLERALGTLERHAPAEDEVLAGMRAGIARRRRRRQVASVMGAAAMVAGVAGGAVYVMPLRGPEQTGIVAAPPTTPAKTPPAPPSLPFAAGWIPDGYQLDSWEVGSTEASVQFGGTKDFQTVVVWISGTARERIAGDTEEPATIAGRPGVIRRLAPDAKETQLIWQLADGRWVMVGGRAPTVPLATLRRVADNLAFTKTPVPAPFSLTSLPDGYNALTWMGGRGTPRVGSVTMCRSVVEPRAGTMPADCVSVAMGDGPAPKTLLTKTPKGGTGLEEIPIDQEQMADGVLTRATADGTTVVAQLSTGRWVQANSQGAGVDLLRQVVTLVRS